MQLYLIDGGHFCAGIELCCQSKDSRVSGAAPILRYMVGWNMSQVRTYCKRKGWKLMGAFGGANLLNYPHDRVAS